MVVQCCPGETSFWLGTAAVTSTKKASKVIVIMLMCVDDYELLLWQNGMICRPATCQLTHATASV